MSFNCDAVCLRAELVDEECVLAERLTESDETVRDEVRGDNGGDMGGDNGAIVVCLWNI